MFIAFLLEESRQNLLSTFFNAALTAEQGFTKNL